MSAGPQPGCPDNSGTSASAFALPFQLNATDLALPTGSRRSGPWHAAGSWRPNRLTSIRGRRRLGAAAGAPGQFHPIGRQRLTVAGHRHSALSYEIGQESLDLERGHLGKMTRAVESHEGTAPVHIAPYVRMLKSAPGRAHAPDRSGDRRARANDRRARAATPAQSLSGERPCTGAAQATRSTDSRDGTARIFTCQGEERHGESFGSRLH